jgi:gamma-glutamylcysteine synthetase
VLNENVSKSIDCCFDFIYKFQVGLLYDDDSLQAILDLTADWTPAEREMLRNKVITRRTTFTFSYSTVRKHLVIN